MKIKIQVLVTALLLCSGMAMSQPPRGPLVISPQVQADKTVTFRYLAPLAKEVKLSAQFEKVPLAMSKDAQGVWSVTVGPIKPDIYPYSFQVDGVTVMDPANVAFFPNERFKASLVDVPGDSPLIHAMRDVPHGATSYEYYPSLEGTTGSVVVYTPPGYDQNPTKKYPVFYLISGTTDTEETYFKVGRTNLILDNLIAEGKAKAMIIVMPYGNIAARVAEQKGGSKPADPMVRDGDDAVKRAKDFETDLLTKVIPYVEKNYRTLNNRENRAIGGFSRGGGQTLRAAFGNMDKFAWVCSYSSYLSPTEMDRNFSQIGTKADLTNKQLKLLWVGVGDEDFLYKGTLEFIDYLKAKNIQYKSRITGGGHTWMNAKQYLAETAQLLFQ
ncbi:MAG TPA: alpha/beta hydrolase-fold protein [Haliscomenobacter sp.]|uniref:Esterase n=1 Tax=Haliscomenobacter hydrossis (strain ATCC 27775 / DSM 1100 / LMG 10767 / O) TaxID=760192 RepID=F4KZA9_HALH1|nr:MULTISPECIES: esterase [Haliscomenobacter]AEE48404.1 esterase [Haliscomenobacter hydrossis DSM 1100]HOY21180.1 alpha/beta hydrolase-fold protein [Haliscomenobacter sp.]